MDCLKPECYQSTSDATVVLIVFFEGHERERLEDILTYMDTIDAHDIVSHTQDTQYNILVHDTLLQSNTRQVSQSLIDK